MMERNFVLMKRRWIEKGRRRGKVQGQRRFVHMVLEDRFHTLPEIVHNYVEQTSNMDEQASLVRMACESPSPEAFLAQLATIPRYRTFRQKAERKD